MRSAVVIALTVLAARLATVFAIPNLALRTIALAILSATNRVALRGSRERRPGVHTAAVLFVAAVDHMVRTLLAVLVARAGDTTAVALSVVFFLSTLDRTSDLCRQAADRQHLRSHFGGT